MQASLCEIVRTAFWSLVHEAEWVLKDVEDACFNFLTLGGSHK